MVRVLVAGDPSSSLAYVAKKLSALNAKSGPFAFALLTHPPSTAAPSSPPPPPFPLPTFFASQHPPSTPAPSLHNLGPASALSHSSLTVLLLAAGYDDPPSAATPLPPELAAALTQAGASGAGFRGVDILVAPTPPRGLSLAPASPTAPPPSSLVARVATAARPRYHFCGAAAFADLAPFIAPGAVAATRLFALAPAARRSKGAPEPQRWLYAADVRPLAGMAVADLAETRAGMLVACPYDVGGSGSVGNGGKSGGGGSKESRGVKRPRSGRGGGRQSTATPRDAKCWFCLASGKDTHLVLAVGEHFYVAAAKGGLVPEHVLIVPVNHVHSSMDSGMSAEMHAEVEVWKTAVRHWFRDHLAASAYFFERAVHTRGGWQQMHMHIQCIPMEASSGAAARAAVGAVAAECAMKAVEVLPDDQPCALRLRQLFAEAAAADADAGAKPEKSFEYFWGELPDGTRVVQSVTRAKRLAAAERSAAAERPAAAMAAAPAVGAGDEAAADDSVTDAASADAADAAAAAVGAPPPAVADAAEAAEAPVAGGSGKLEERARRVGAHPLHFGRKIAAVALGLPDRVDWKTCVGALREEQRAANRVRDSFAAFEPPEFDGGDE